MTMDPFLHPEVVAPRKAVPDAASLVVRDDLSGMTEVFDPHVGGYLELADASTEQLVALAAHLDTWIGYARDARGEVGRRIVQHMDEINTHTVRATDDVATWKATAPASTKTVSYPAQATYDALAKLVEDGVLAQAAMDGAVEKVTPEPVYRIVNKAKVNQLIRHPDERVRQAVEAVRVESDRTDRTVKLERDRARAS